jgi:hypothetical protein
MAETKPNYYRHPSRIDHRRDVMGVDPGVAAEHDEVRYGIKNPSKVVKPDAKNATGESRSSLTSTQEEITSVQSPLDASSLTGK